MKIGLIILVILIIGVLALIFYGRIGATISGTILDCNTQQPVRGAQITAEQPGWGFAPYLVWDKDYSENAISATDGSFSIHLPINASVKLSINKRGYIDAIEYRDPGNNQNLKILAGLQDEDHEPPGGIVYTMNCAVQ